MSLGTCPRPPFDLSAASTPGRMSTYAFERPLPTSTVKHEACHLKVALIYDVCHSGRRIVAYLASG